MGSSLNLSATVEALMLGIVMGMAPRSAGHFLSLQLQTECSNVIEAPCPSRSSAFSFPFLGKQFFWVEGQLP